MRLKLPGAVLLLLLLLLWIATSACACTDLLQRALGVGREQAKMTSVPSKATTPRSTDVPGTFVLELTEADIQEMLADEQPRHYHRGGGRSDSRRWPGAGESPSK